MRDWRRSDRRPFVPAYVSACLRPSPLSHPPSLPPSILSVWLPFVRACLHVLCVCVCRGFLYSHSFLLSRPYALPLSLMYFVHPSIHPSIHPYGVIFVDYSLCVVWLLTDYLTAWMGGWMDERVCLCRAVSLRERKAPAFCPIDRRQTDGQLAVCVCSMASIAQHTLRTPNTTTQYRQRHTTNFHARQIRGRGARGITSHVCVRPASPWVPSVAWHRNGAVASSGTQAGRQTGNHCPCAHK